MLQFAALDSSTLELLIKLQKLPVFSGLRLAGGTSLALQIGHRKSVDLDLFGNLDGDEIEINESLQKFKNVHLLKHTKNIHIYLIENIKVDFVNYPYPWIDNPLRTENLVLAGKKDIAAMKLAAITGRGTMKDFIDLFFLLNDFSLKEMLGFYNKKYFDGSEFIVLKSLTYFNDAESDEEPIMLNPISWKKVKTKIMQAVKKYVNEAV